MTRVKQERANLEKSQGDLFEKELENSSTRSESNNPIIDFLDFEDDIEKALASVFGDELMASINEKHSTYWKNLSSNNKKVNFPPEIIPFSNIIKAPDNLKKRLSYIGLVKNKENIDQLQSNLFDGLILVSQLGEIWRWDGFTSK